MKLSASSSIIFATLALSSSTTSLAAPASNVQDSGMSTSSSHSDLYESGAHVPSHCTVHRPQASDAKSETFVVRSNPSQFASRDILGLGKMITPLPIIGPLLGPILSSLYAKPSATADGQNATDPTTENISPEDINALQIGIQEVTRLLNQTIPKPIQNVTNGSPIAPVVQGDANAFAIPSASSSSASAMSASATPTPSAFKDDVTPSSTLSSSASATPSSPPMPSNPPNTPSLPTKFPL